MYLLSKSRRLIAELKYFQTIKKKLLLFFAEHFEERGVTCCFDNTHVASSVHLLFLCVLPSQLAGVAEELRGHLSPRTLVYSFVSGISLVKLRQLLEHDNVIAATLRWNDDKASSWDLSLGVNECFERPAVVSQTFPLLSASTADESEESKFLSQLFL